VYEGPRINVNRKYGGYLSKKSKSLVSFRIGSSMTSKINRSKKGITNVSSTRYPSTLFICNIILHPGSSINLEFARINRATKTFIILSCIDIIGIILWIIDMFLGSVDA
jgi:hypothetical protein